MTNHSLNVDEKGVHKGMTDIMVDLETTGLDPINNGIVQLGAKKFNIKTGQVGKDVFIANIKLLPSRTWSDSTRVWWDSQEKAICEGVFENPLDPELVMRAFADWCYPMNTLRFWSKPTHYDFVMVQSYFDELQIPNPFHYRIATDMNSFITGIHFPNKRPDVPYKDIGQAHNALADVTNQLNELLAHVKYVSQKQ